jgi:hypothetical protein
VVLYRRLSGLSPSFALIYEAYQSSVSRFVQQSRFRALSAEQVQEWLNINFVNVANEIGPMINDRLEQFFKNMNH